MWNEYTQSQDLNRQQFNYNLGNQQGSEETAGGFKFSKSEVNVIRM
jgi:hypothetical protein